MDPVTHTLIGVGIANAAFRKRVGPESTVILALASNLPDVDALVHLTGEPTAILLRRTFGHSLFMFPLWSAVLAVLLKRFWPRIRFTTLYGMILLGAAVHVFFDLVNSFGVVLLWPFSDWRPELGIIFIIDPVLTGLLAAPLVLWLIPVLRPRLVCMSRLFLVLVGAYVAFCGINRMAATQVLVGDSKRLALEASLVDVFPEPLGPQRWHGVVRDGNVYRNFLVHSLSGRVEGREAVRTEVDDPAVERVRRTRLGRRLEWFFKAPVWEVQRDPVPANSRSEPLTNVSVHDLRFTSLVIQRGNPFVFHFHVPANGAVEFMGGRGWEG